MAFKEKKMSSLIDDIKVKSQYFLPKKLISRAAGFLASRDLGSLTEGLIKTFIAHYQVDLSEAEITDPKGYKTFNAFFTRALKKGARPIASAAPAVVNPADGTISEFGEIYKDAVLQAKGHYYSLTALLGGDEKDAEPFLSGAFYTTNLSPKDYHRVHMPFDGKLEKMVFVPGTLFSVNPLTAQNVDNLFAKNERVICFFKNEKLGRFAVVLVGATIVASIETVFQGVIAPSAGREKTIYHYEKDNITFKKGDELGRFLLGSTTVCVFENKKITFEKALKAGQSVKMGQKMATLASQTPKTKKTPAK